MSLGMFGRVVLPRAGGRSRRVADMMVVGPTPLAMPATAAPAWDSSPVRWHSRSESANPVLALYPRECKGFRPPPRKPCAGDSDTPGEIATGAHLPGDRDAPHRR